MTANPNPFADDLPQEVQRQQSAADPLNPYAAPVNAEALERPEVIGVWRDGSLLVMHRRATLPELCVVSGEPTSGRHWETLRWTKPVDWGDRALIVEYGIQPEILRARRKFPVFAFVASVLVWTILLSFTAWFVQANDLKGARAEDAYNLAIFASILLSGISFVPFVIAQRGTKAIKLVNIDRHYVWIQGPCEAFLRTLPPWSELESFGGKAEGKPA